MKKHWSTIKSMLHPLKWIVPSVMLLAAGGEIQAHESESTISMETQQSTAKTITGKVRDVNGEPLIGVSVAVKGTTTGTMTDMSGHYSLKIEGASAQLVFSYVGYKTVTLTANKTLIDVTLQEDATMIDEVVVVGYGVQKKENLTGAIATVDLGKALDSRPVADVGRALQGAVPGLSVTTSSGELGKAPSIKIRGGNMSPNSQNGGEALILLDNVEISDITLINPDDIESITVLKDASSSSIYGARGANGVILVTSKNKNKNESIRVSYSNNFAWRTTTKTPTQLPAWQQADINLQGVKRLNGALDYNIVGNMKVNAQVMQKMKEWDELYGGQNLGREMEYGRDFEINDSGTYFYRSWDWYDMFVRDWTPQQSHNASISGGSEKFSYNASLGYMSQEGMTKVNSDNFHRYNGALSVNSKLSKYVAVRANMMYSSSTKEEPYIYNSLGPVYDYMYYLYRWQPVYPYGTYEGKEFRSAITDLNQAEMMKTQKDYWRLGAGLTLNLMEGLTLDTDFYYDVNDNFNKQNGSRLYGYNIFAAQTSLTTLANSYGDYTNGDFMKLKESRGKVQKYTSNTVGTYTKTLNKAHTFKFMLGANIESSEYRMMEGTREQLFDSNLPELNLGYGRQLVGADHVEWAVAGFFGRVNYDYQGKYLLELNGRYDGSSKFPDGDKFGFFTSGSVGYRITEEKFMEPLKPFLSDLKLRASYGEIGSQDVPAASYLSKITMKSNSGWMSGGQMNIGADNPTIVNSRLTWEKIKTVDVGFDMRLWENKIGVTFDWYRKKTVDLHSQGDPLPDTLGGSAPKTNFGELETPGWELAVDFYHKFDNGFGINLGAQLSDTYTKVTKWSRDAANLPGYGSGGEGWYKVTNNYREGMKLGDIWGYKVDRLFQESDFNADGSLKAGIPDHSKIYGATKIEPGYVKYKDLDGDGVIYHGNGTSDESGDKAVIGNMFPRYEYGFTIGADYKGFDFKIFFQGVGKRHIWAAGNQVLPGYTSGEPFYKGAEDYWTPENTGAFYPAPYDYKQATKYSYEINDRYLLNMAYLRAKTLTLGYTLPAELVKKAYMQKVRVYFTGENLFEFDKVKPAIDAETGIKMVEKRQDSRNFGRSYPYYRTVSFGLQVVF